MTQWFLDACSLINLYASGRLGEIAEQQGQPFLLVPKVIEEANWIYVREGNERGSRVPIELDSLIGRGALAVTPLTRDIQAHFIRLAVELDDGEAMTIAAASEHNVGVITDDEAALKYLGQKTGLQASTSLTLLRQHLSEVPAEACLDVILNLRICARYYSWPSPSRSHLVAVLYPTGA